MSKLVIFHYLNKKQQLSGKTFYKTIYRQRLNKSLLLFMGPNFLTQSNPTHRWTDPRIHICHIHAGELSWWGLGSSTPCSFYIFSPRERRLSRFLAMHK